MWSGRVNRSTTIPQVRYPLRWEEPFGRTGILAASLPTQLTIWLTMAEAGDPRRNVRDPTTDGAREELERALERVPLGTFAVAGIAVALLIIGYLYVYLAVFLPRGTVS